jgi:hypothetical protein
MSSSPKIFAKATSRVPGSQIAAVWPRSLSSQFDRTFEQCNLWDDVLWLSCDEGLQVLYQLVGQGLHCPSACPCDMRSEQEIRQLQLEQGVAQMRRFHGKHIEPSACNPAQSQSIIQRLLID